MIYIQRLFVGLFVTALIATPVWLLATLADQHPKTVAALCLTGVLLVWGVVFGELVQLLYRGWRGKAIW